MSTLPNIPPTPHLPAGDRLLTPDEVAALLGTTTASLATARCRRRWGLRWCRVGRRVAYRLSTVQAFMAAQEVTP